MTGPITEEDVALIEVLHHAGSGLRAGLDWMDGEFSDSDYDQNNLLAEANAKMFAAHYAVNEALARPRRPYPGCGNGGAADGGAGVLHRR